jgi:hypothetical protein
MLRTSARVAAPGARALARLRMVLAAFAAALMAKQGAVIDVPSGRGAMRDAWRDAEVRN